MEAQRLPMTGLSLFSDKWQHQALPSGFLPPSPTSQLPQPVLNLLINWIHLSHDSLQY